MQTREYLLRVVTDEIKRRMVEDAFETCPALSGVRDQEEIGSALGGTLALGILYGMLLAREGIDLDNEAMVGAQIQFPELAEALERLRCS